MLRIRAPSGRWASALCVAGSFALTRLVHLTVLPLFIDESVYLFWARRLALEGDFVRPLADGKSLQVFILSLVVSRVRDPVLWGRTLSVLAGGVGAWTAWALGRRLENNGAGLIAAALYVACPFALFHDRMILADVFLSSAAAITVLATLVVVDRPTLGRGVVLGLAMAACALCKIPGLLAWITPLLAIALLPRRAGVGKAMATAFAVASALTAKALAFFLTYSVQVQAQGAGPESGGPVEVVVPNLETLAAWLWAYWTPVICGLFVVGATMALLRRRREEILVVGSAIVPLAAFVLLSRSWFPRYAFPSTIPALVLAGLSVSRILGRVRSLRRWWLVPAVTLAAVGLLRPMLAFDWALVSRPDTAPFPKVDRIQYVSGWSAGYGRSETAEAVAAALGRAPQGLVLGVGGVSRHGWRPLYLLLRARLMNEPRATIEVIDPGDPQDREGLIRRAGHRPALLAVAVEGESGPVIGSPPIFVDRRADGVVETLLYRLSPPSSN